MSDETPESLIPYDEIVQEALRDVVGRVLRRGREDRAGCPAATISTSPSRPGCRASSIPKHLVERFPDEMTIVIQHRFWDLKVEDDVFSVGLSFGGVPSTLIVPFAAVTQFHDPAVEFSLTFQANAEDEPPRSMRKPENDAPPASRRGRLQRRRVDFTRKK